MPLGLFSAVFGGRNTQFIAATDVNGNTALGHVTVDANGVPQGTLANPIVIGTGQAPVSVSAAALPLPLGAAQDGTDATGVVPPVGGAGLRGWATGAYAQLVAIAVSLAGTLSVRLSSSLPAGSATIGAVTQAGTWTVGLSSNNLTLGGALPAGSNIIGAVTQASGPWTVSWSGQSVGATQSGAWTVGLSAGSTVALAAGSAAIGSVSVTGSVAVTGSFYQSIQPISAATLPLPAGAAQDGSDATGVTSPTGGAGFRGWLSGIYAKLSGTLTVSGTVTANAGTGIMAVSAAALPLPAGAATAALQPVINADGGAQTHIMNFPASQAVTLTALPALSAGSAAIGSVVVSAMPALSAGANTIGAVIRDAFGHLARAIGRAIIDPSLAGLSQQLKAIRTELRSMSDTIDTELSKLRDDVAAQSIVIASATAAFRGLAAQLAAAEASARSAGATDAQISSVSAVRQTLESNTAALAAAIPANTPVATTAGSTAPVDAPPSPEQAASPEQPPTA